MRRPDGRGKQGATAHFGLRSETLTLLVVCCCKDQDQLILFATWLRHLVHLCCFVVTDVLMDVGDNSPGDALRAVEGRTRAGGAGGATE